MAAKHDRSTAFKQTNRLGQLPRSCQVDQQMDMIGHDHGRPQAPTINMLGVIEQGGGHRFIFKAAVSALRTYRQKIGSSTQRLPASPKRSLAFVDVEWKRHRKLYRGIKPLLHGDEKVIF
jgi:hypothetical protein